ncbi:GNAT family N-acetyltransferase [Biostraticola tofi]|uniref:Putative N-acetyltransferase YhbS n=1 Tax=Biostraticola tofi TaxID=466109 RepID=A0A4R3YP05_9GAMM|nr:GNAT family N-acetyltransferase [Biostraticola tofi]TCV92633.1 putative N-acetyltransferase YhbS [Biostraticola tofi]
MTMTISLLADYPQFADAVVECLSQEFGGVVSRPFYAALVQNSLRRQGLPITFIALRNGKLVGTAGLWRADLLARQDLTPWLAALYIDGDNRQQGIGQRLQQAVADFAVQSGFEHLYLYTTLVGYYERSGWSYIGDAIEYPDHSVRLYHRVL